MLTMALVGSRSVAIKLGRQPGQLSETTIALWLSSGAFVAIEDLAPSDAVLQQVDMYMARSSSGAAGKQPRTHIFSRRTDRFDFTR